VLRTTVRYCVLRTTVRYCVLRTTVRYCVLRTTVVQRAPDDGWSSVVHQAPYVVDDALATVFGASLHQYAVEATWNDAPLRQRGITPRLASNFLREQARELA
jgi:hypothetical protein